MSIILQKFIADSGACSRRKAEELIRLGAVKVNGAPGELGMRVSEQDEVMVLGKKIALAKIKTYIKLNKPEGYACTTTKVTGEKNVFDLVRTKERLVIVGRLDKNSRGLVLLTNNGELTQEITHPSFEHEKKYLVRIKCHCEEQQRRGNLRLSGSNIETCEEIIKEKEEALEIIKNFKEGIDIGDGDGIVKAKNIRFLGNGRFEIVLTSGKKRQIRRMFKELGYEVVDLLRTQIASLKLGSLKEGKWQKLSEQEINYLIKNI